MKIIAILLINHKQVPNEFQQILNMAVEVRDSDSVPCNKAETYT